MKQIFKENNEYISKILYQSNNREINDLDLNLDSDSDKEDSTETLEEEKNNETGEVNPNLIYSDDELKEN